MNLPSGTMSADPSPPSSYSNPSCVISDLLESGAPERPAILAPGLTPLPRRGLAQLAGNRGARIRDWGISRTDCVAIVLAPGPELAAVFLTVSSVAVAAPLNPGYVEREFLYYLKDLKARALIVERGSAKPARRAARALGIAVLETERKESDAAGFFRWASPFPEPPGPSRPAKSPRPDDVALALHTSGTTSRPKLVPLLHRNLVASAHSIAKTLRLGPRDRSLCIMPLFHIHGLAASLLAPLASGGSVFCAPGFSALRFFNWLIESRATWYSASPAMHQAILARAASRSVSIKTRLRFIRSSSSPLPPSVQKGLEARFGAPVVEAYSMTEAAHQMTSNPLPPGRRKPGTVGIAQGCEIAVQDPAGGFPKRGEIGEVVVRGPGVVPRYAAGDQGTNAFQDGWFRTGDLGRLDSDGYLELVGRVKEVINRGGEKISPMEIDAALADHPRIRSAVAFALPHPKLGEEPAVAVAPLGGRDAVTARDVRTFLEERLASFKVPRRIFLVEDIPVGATGKVRRQALPKALGIL